MMRKKMKRLLTVLVVGAMLCANLPVNGITMQAKAADEKQETSDYPNDLKLLTYSDYEALKEWTDEVIRFTDDEAAEIKAYMDAYIINGITDDYEKAKAIYDWIYKNVEYGSDPNANISLAPYEVFTNRVAVCGGYSNLYKAMLNLVDIPSVLISGNTPYGAHIWNAVYADEKWFYSDCTWGGEYFDKGVTSFLEDHYSLRIESFSIETDDGILLGYDQGIAVVGVTDGNTSVNVPDMYGDLYVTSISYQLFAQKYGVKELIVGAYVNAIDTQMRSDTLESITVSGANQTYASRDGVLFTKDLKQVLTYPAKKTSKTFTLPKETVSFDVKETFSNPHLENLEVETGNSAYSSYDGALYNVDKTELLVVPAGRTEIEILPDASVNDFAFVSVDTSNFTIYGEEGSPAHQYAMMYQINFENKKEIVNQFEDVYEGDYYYEPVLWAVEKGITDGWTETFYAPEMGCTRGQVVTFLWRAAGEPKSTNAENPFTDVAKNAYYYDAVLWAVEEGITDGWTGTTFAPDMTCTRGQIVTFIWRAAEKPAAGSDVNPFVDVAEGTYYYDAVLWAVEKGITDGWTTTEFAPDMECTRGQIVTFLHRHYK